MSLCEVIEAVEGPIAITSCVTEAPEPCGAEGRCPSRGKWDPVNRAIRLALQELKLSDMASRGCGAPAQRLVQVTMPRALEEGRAK
jgi:DNA-binding IscR family transcriptional regulator